MMEVGCVEVQNSKSSNGLTEEAFSYIYQAVFLRLKSEIDVYFDGMSEVSISMMVSYTKLCNL